MNMIVSLLRLLIHTVLIFLLSVSAYAQKLPGNIEFQLWTDSTVYKKAYHVAQNHPSSSDENPGTYNQPFKSIARAAELLKPGEKVIIHAGIYREFVRPVQGGTGPSAMIAYESAPEERVVISGAIPIQGSWDLSLNKNGNKTSVQTWQVSLDSTLDMSKLNPFNQLNATPNQMKIMNWATHLTGKAPFSLQRGMILQEGQHLIQLSSYEDLARVDGSFWVDTLKKVLHVNPVGYEHPDSVRLELTQFEHLMKPKAVGTSYIKVKGITFRHAGNGFMRTGVGAIFLNGGNHWIIENNTIHSINSVGIEIGTDYTEEEKLSASAKQKLLLNAGGVIVRNNEIYDCGTGGIQGHKNFDALIESNHIHHIGWQDAEFYWECAAIKLLVNRRTLVQKNRIHDIIAANAIWLDWDNMNSRIADNLIYDILPARGGAIFIEASRKTENWIDHNILWNIANIAVSVYDSDSIRTFNNLIAKTGTPYISRTNTKGRMVDGRELTSVYNSLDYNILYKNRSLPIRADSSNTANYNLFVDNNFAEFQQQKWGTGNFEHQLEIELSPDELRFKSENEFPIKELRASLKEGFEKKYLDQEKIYYGPYKSIFTGEISFTLSQ